jgi:outer membrane protein assembly factor BamE
VGIPGEREVAIESKKRELQMRRYHSAHFSPDPLLPMSSARLAAPLVLVALAALAGCESVRTWTPGLLRPYRPDVQQGNVVTREMTEQLRQGMSREQVRFLLGTPLLTSVFHQDRWDYLYYLKRGRDDERQQRKLTVWFKDNRLDHFESDEMPDEKVADNLILGRDRKPPAKTPPPQPAAPVNIPAK